jgi:hypothetical protein
MVLPKLILLLVPAPFVLLKLTSVKKFYSDIKP